MQPPCFPFLERAEVKIVGRKRSIKHPRCMNHERLECRHDHAAWTLHGVRPEERHHLVPLQQQGQDRQIQRGTEKRVCEHVVCSQRLTNTEICDATSIRLNCSLIFRRRIVFNGLDLFLYQEPGVAFRPDIRRNNSVRPVLLLWYSCWHWGHAVGLVIMLFSRQACHLRFTRSDCAS